MSLFCTSASLQVVYRNVRTLSQTVRLLSGLRPIILGIESTCDDTGAAVVDVCGTVLGEAIASQLATHNRLGGINPPVAGRLHMQNIEPVVSKALDHAGCSVEDLDAVAVAVEPGLALCLKIGSQHALNLCRDTKKPIIPIHHMQAHALTVRMEKKVDFPFLCLLISGGHSLLCWVKGVDQFELLGDSCDDAIGEAFDKVARRLKLRNLGVEFESISGGRAIEKLAAEGGNRLAFEYRTPLSRWQDCNFSFSGLKSAAFQYIEQQEAAHGLRASDMLTNLSDFCASFQHACFRHLAKRLQRAIEYLHTQQILRKGEGTLVISGGVACNNYLTDMLAQVAAQYGMVTHWPPPKLCSDNGIMIAWNGIEKWNASIGVIHNLPEQLVVKPWSPIGLDKRGDVAAARLRITTRIKLNSLVPSKSRNESKH